MSETHELLSAEEFQDCLNNIGWSLRELERRLNINPTTVRRWEYGHLPIPGVVASWLRGLADAHRAAPLPQDWRQR